MQTLHVNPPLLAEIVLKHSYFVSFGQNGTNLMILQGVRESMLYKNVLEILTFGSHFFDWSLFWNEHNNSHRRIFSKTRITTNHPELNPIFPRARCQLIIQSILS